MIAFILAAGPSTRLTTLTLNKHKCLLEIIDNLKIIDMKPAGDLMFIKKLFPSLLANEISFCVKKI